MKLEERYIRTYDGFIRRIKVVSKENAPLVLCVINSKPYTVDDIKKSSPNIIDLVEEGDYVNGSEVLMIENTENEIVLVVYERYIYAEDIKSIITREQIEQVSYKVVE